MLLSDNFFLFSLTAARVNQLKFEGYRPWDYYQANPQLKDAIDLIASGYFSSDRSIQEYCERI